MSGVSTAKRKIYQTLEALPPQGIEELIQFLDFLQHKYRTQQRTKVVTLGGTWEDIPFDITDEEIRTLRRRVTDILLTKM